MSTTPDNNNQTTGSSQASGAMPRPNQNPLTEEELHKRLAEERMTAIEQEKVAEQEMIKARIEMQGFEYTPPADMAKYPSLQPTVKLTKDTTAEEVNPNLGETTIVDVVPDSQKTPVQVKKDNVQSSQGIKG